MRLQSTAVVALVAITVLAVVPSSLVAANGYQISSGDADSMPERTVDFQDSTFTIDSLITADPGDEISVDVSAPNEVYRVYIYNSEEQIVDSKYGNGSQGFTFDLSGYDPGSYPITVYHDGDYEAVQPLVVEGYDVSVDAPSSVEQGETATVEIEVDQTDASSSPAHVRAVIANDDEELVVDASESGGTYEATFDGDELDTGSYTVYGAAQGSTTIMDRNELLGVSSRSSLSVEDASTATATATPDTGSDGDDGNDGDDGGDGGNNAGGGGGGGDGGAADDTETPTATPTATPEPNSTAASPTATATVTATATDAPSDETSTDTPVETTAVETTATATDVTTTAQPTETTNTDAVTTTEEQTPTDTPTVGQTDDGIDPATQAGTAEEAQTGTADSGPGFTLVGTGLAVLAGAVLLMLIRRD